MEHGRCDPFSLTSDQGNLDSLIVGTDYMYWLDLDTGGVMRRTQLDGTITPVITYLELTEIVLAGQTICGITGTKVLKDDASGGMPSWALEQASPTLPQMEAPCSRLI